jgi:hypothetical protein
LKSPTNGLLSGVILGLALFLATMPLAALHERWVEQGGIRLGERILNTPWSLFHPARPKEALAPLLGDVKLQSSPGHRS